MKRLMLQHAFGFVDRVIFLVGRQNLRSQRALEKIGGVRLESRPDEGGRENIVYQITRESVAPTNDDWRPTTDCENSVLHCRQRRWLHRNRR
jgi:RimJ/RimL family protein N-acetyltransferase